MSSYGSKTIFKEVYMMKVLRGMYIGLILVVGFPVVLALVAVTIGMCVYNVIRYGGDLGDMLKDVLAEPIRFAVYLYKNWIVYGNKFSLYPKDGFTL
jgi:hypothetical protein